jgi:drug/metabolite transporter (DMT)-like permease
VIKYSYIALGIMLSALAQILLKYASGHKTFSSCWITYIGVSLVSYGLAFCLYAIILKYFPISRISPVMTVGVVVLVVFFWNLFRRSFRSQTSYRTSVWINFSLFVFSLTCPSINWLCWATCMVGRILA